MYENILITPILFKLKILHFHHSFIPPKINEEAWGQIILDP